MIQKRFTFKRIRKIADLLIVLELQFFWLSNYFYRILCRLIYLKCFLNLANYNAKRNYKITQTTFDFKCIHLVL